PLVVPAQRSVGNRQHWSGTTRGTRHQARWLKPACDAYFFTFAGSSTTSPRSTVPPALTSTGWPLAAPDETNPAFSCQMIRFWVPAGTPVISNEPSLWVTAKNGWSQTRTQPCIQP